LTIPTLCSCSLTLNNKVNLVYVRFIVVSNNYVLIYRYLVDLASTICLFKGLIHANLRHRFSFEMESVNGSLKQLYTTGMPASVNLCSY